MLCGNCPFFNPNGGITTDSAIYFPYSPVKLGNCTKGNGLKNEQNSCAAMQGIKLEKILQVMLERDYNPTEIGIYILENLGYHVHQYLEGSIVVKDEDGNILYYSD